MLALRVHFLTFALTAALSAVLSARAASAGETVLLDFTATWCGPCQAMNPTIDRLTAAGYPVRKVDLDQNRQLAAQYGVTSVPTFLLLVDGRQAERLVGGTSYERLIAMFQKAGVRHAGSRRRLRNEEEKPGEREGRRQEGRGNGLHTPSTGFRDFASGSPRFKKAWALMPKRTSPASAAA